MKEKTAVSAVPAGRIGSRDAGRAAAAVLVWCLLGIAVPRATLYGEMAPFGISLAAAAEGVSILPVCLSLAAGYLLSGTVEPLRYIAAVAAVGGIRWVLSALPSGKPRLWLPPLLAFLGTAVTGVAIAAGDGADSFRLLLVFAESTVAAGFSCFFHATARRLTAGSETGTETSPMSSGTQAALVLSGAVVLMALSTITFRDFSPGRVLAVLLILLLARSGRETGGCMAGCVIGASVALSVPGMTVPAAALAFGGLIAGVFSRFGRVAEAATFLAAAGVIIMGDVDETLLVYLYEILAAGVLFVLLPRQLERQLNHLLLRGRDNPEAEGLRRAMVMRLQVASSAMEEVAQTVTQVSDKLARYSEPDPTAIFRSSSEAVCRHCGIYALCWEEHYDEMMGALGALSPLLRKGGRVDISQLTGWPARQCRQPDRLLDYINRSYSDYVVREGAWQRLREIQGAIRGQFGGMGSLLREMALEMDNRQQVDTELSGRVLAVCADYGMPVKDALCTRRHGNRLTVEILTADVGVRLDGGRWLRDMQQVCDRDFAAPAVIETGDSLRVTLTERPRYTVETAIAQRCCDSEKLCGDAADFFSFKGQTAVLLSDGMGSGGRAAVDGAMAVGLTARLWKAGFSAAGILDTVNAALMVKCREESLATLDIAVIDEFSGRLDCYKAGAVSTLLRSGGRVSRLEGSSLPLGILRDIRPAHCHDLLNAGDILLVVSDGALADGLAPLEIRLRELPEESTMQQLADAVADEARKAQGEHQDDITVIALRLQNARRPGKD